MQAADVQPPTGAGDAGDLADLGSPGASADMDIRSPSDRPAEVRLAELRFGGLPDDALAGYDNVCPEDYGPTVQLAPAAAAPYKRSGEPW